MRSRSTRHLLLVTMALACTVSACAAMRQSGTSVDVRVALPAREEYDPHNPYPEKPYADGDLDSTGLVLVPMNRRVRVRVEGAIPGTIMRAELLTAPAPYKQLWSDSCQTNTRGNCEMHLPASVVQGLTGYYYLAVDGPHRAGVRAIRLTP